MARIGSWKRIENPSIGTTAWMNLDTGKRVFYFSEPIRIWVEGVGSRYFSTRKKALEYARSYMKTGKYSKTYPSGVKANPNG